MELGGADTNTVQWPVTGQQHKNTWVESELHGLESHQQSHIYY